MEGSSAVEALRALYEGRRADFERHVRTMAAQEREKGHKALSQQLVELADQSRHSQARSIAPLTKPVPVAAPEPAEDNETACWTVVEPTEDLESLVLPTTLKDQMDLFAKELANQSALRAWGIDSAPRALLVGPPGTGKTHAALAMAAKGGRIVHTLNLDEVFSSYLGETSRNLRQAFDAAAEAGAVLFLDEVDALGKERGDPQELGELKRVVNALLQNLDRTRHTLPVIAATNHAQLLDVAISRRFTDILRFDAPDSSAVKQILRQQLARMPRATSIDLDSVAATIHGFTGAQIANVARNAARRAFGLGHRTIRTEDLLEAIARMQSSATPAVSVATRFESIQHMLAWIKDQRAQGVKLETIGAKIGKSRSAISRYLQGQVPKRVLT